nr:uroporphyrinogen-III synthase [Aidingimonas lacisalsi]
MYRPRVLITRPGERGRVLASALSSRGMAVEPLDMMYQEMLPETPAMRACWLDFDHFSRIIVVSPFAAECLADALDRYWPQLPIGPQYYAVGSATAEVLSRELQVKVHLPVAANTFQPRRETSEALLALPSLQHLDEEKVLLVAGVGGRTALTETLTSRGARLTRLALYRRVVTSPQGAMRDCLSDGLFDALIVSSGELLEHLAGWCGSAALNQPLIVSSQRLATLAVNLGFADPRVAAGATATKLAAMTARVCGLEGGDVDHDDLEKG